MTQKTSECAIECNEHCGPVFGNGYDLMINDKCYKEKSCSISNDGRFSYECDQQKRASLYVNTGDDFETNRFAVLDYEVFGIEDYNYDYIQSACSYPKLILEYIKTGDISSDELKGFRDDTEILHDLKTIQCKDEAIRIKISQSISHHPSQLLQGSLIVDCKYDGFLEDWLNDQLEWRVVFRASEHNYEAKKFHEYCDSIQNPMIVIVKSTEGWIFGGYTGKVEEEEKDCEQSIPLIELLIE